MDVMRFERESTFGCSVEELWAFHLRPDALPLLAPPGSFFRVVDPGGGVADGSVLEATVGPWPLRVRWEALHAGVRPGEGFVDVALESPFPMWVHQHSVERFGPGRARLRDVVWLVPPPWIPAPLARPLLRAVLALMFAWRHSRTRREVESDAAPGAGPVPVSAGADRRACAR